MLQLGMASEAVKLWTYVQERGPSSGKSAQDGQADMKLLVQ